MTIKVANFSYFEQKRIQNFDLGQKNVQMINFKIMVDTSFLKCLDNMKRDIYVLMMLQIDTLDGISSRMNLQYSRNDELD